MKLVGTSWLIFALIITRHYCQGLSIPHKQNYKCLSYVAWFSTVIGGWVTCQILHLPNWQVVVKSHLPTEISACNGRLAGASVSACLYHTSWATNSHHQSNLPVNHLFTFSMLMYIIVLHHPWRRAVKGLHRTPPCSWMFTTYCKQNFNRCLWNGSDEI